MISLPMMFDVAVGATHDHARQLKFLPGIEGRAHLETGRLQRRVLRLVQQGGRDLVADLGVRRPNDGIARSPAIEHVCFTLLGRP